MNEGELQTSIETELQKKIDAELARLREEEAYKGFLYDKSIGGERVPRPSDDFIRLHVGSLKSEEQIQQEARKNALASDLAEKRELAQREATGIDAEKPSDFDDLRKDPDSLAHAHIVRGDPEGDALINSRPPQSLARHQSEVRGYNPTLIFNSENAAKRVDGISMPKGEGRYVEQFHQQNPQAHEAQESSVFEGLKAEFQAKLAEYEADHPPSETAEITANDLGHSQDQGIGDD